MRMTPMAIRGVVPLFWTHDDSIRFSTG